MARKTTGTHDHVLGETYHVASPEQMTPDFLPEPPQMSPEERERRLPPLRPRRPPLPLPTQPASPTLPESGSETHPKGDAKLFALSPRVVEQAQALSPGTLVSFLAEALKSQGSFINEPSLAQAGGTVFFTGNWYAARSTDGGLTWSYINPFADMPDFCCDQDVIYDRGRNLLLWYRQAVGDAAGRNRFVLGVSSNLGASWCTYSIRPSDLNSTWTTNQSFDFPHIALSDNYLYIHTGMNGKGVPSAVALRLPLDVLASCSGFSGSWWGLGYWSALAQGATTTMYIGDHQAQSNSFRIYRQPENSTNLFWTDVGIPAWLLEQGDTCPSPDGQNWCSRSDSSIRAGWVSKGIVGFMWQARAGNGFPFPYIEAATFSESNNFAYLGRPLVWSPSGAWHYPFVSPNARGDLALTAYFASSGEFPSPHFLIFDDYSPQPPPPWEAYRLSSSTAGAPGLGDYIRNRSFEPSQLGWVTSVYTLHPDPDPKVKPGDPTPLFFILGRQRDLPSIRKYWQV